MQYKNILMISYNKHQKVFFNKIKPQLERDGHKVYHLSNQFYSLKSLFKNNYISLNLDYDKLIKFSYKKKLKKHENILIKKVYKKYLIEKAKLLSDYYYNFLRKNKINTVIVWNGSNYIVSVAARVAKIFGVGTLFLEGGYFPNTLVADPKGVNAKSYLMEKNKEFYEKIDLTDSNYNIVNNIDLEQRKLRDSSNYLTRNTNYNLPEKFIFLPFQVVTDSQLILNSPIVNNMFELFKIVYQGIKKYNKIMDKNYFLVVKEHPSDFGRVDYSSLKEKYNDVVFVTKIDAEKLIEESEIVVTINSTVGLEALTRATNVLTLGKAFYNIKDLVYNVNSKDDFISKMNQAIQNNFNYDLANKFLYYIKEKYLINIDRDNVTYKKTKNLRERINDI